MIGLICLRAWHDFQKRHEDARKAQLIGVAFECLESPEKLQEFKARSSKYDRRLMMGIAMELLPKVRGAYSMAAIQLVREMGALAYASRLAKSRRWWKRAEACAILGNFNEPAVIAHLQTLMDDKRVEVRIEAARAIVKLGAVISVGHLIERLAVGERSPSAAITDLVRLLGAEAVPELVAITQGSRSDIVKILALDALGYLGDLRTVDALTHFDSNSSPEIRLAIMKTLSRLQDPRGVSIVEKGLTDSDPAVRAQAAFCAGQMGMLEFGDRLRNLLSDGVWSVRYCAAEALFRLGPEGVRTLTDAAAELGSSSGAIARGVLLEKNQSAS
jgi:hypothetical protein